MLQDVAFYDVNVDDSAPEWSRQLTLRVTVAVHAAVGVDVFVERLATQLAVRSERVVTTVDTVTSVTGPLEQLLVEVALVRPAAALARYTRTRQTLSFLFRKRYYFISGKWAKHVDQRICMSVCLSVRSHISKLANFTKFSVHVACGRGSVL